VHALPHTATDLHGTACPTPTRCVAVGGRGAAVGVAYYSTTGGRSWQPARLTGGLRAIDGVACISAKVCVAASQLHTGVAASGAIARTTDGGQTWSPVILPGGTATLLAVACASASACVAVGQTEEAADPSATTAAAVLRSTTGGRTWTAVAVPPATWSLDAVACPRAGACFAAGTGSLEPPGPPTGATIIRLP